MIAKKRTEIICMTLMVLFALVSSVSAEGEWATNGDNIYNTHTGGNVGIGTATPGRSLEIISPAESRAAYWKSGHNDASSTFLIRNSDSTDLFDLDADGDLYLKGKVGIGTEVPKRTLHINSNTANAVSRFESTDSRATIEFQDPYGFREIGIQGNSMIFLDKDGLEDMRIDSNGNVGIGATDPGAKLVIRGPNTGTGLLRIHNIGPSTGDVNGIDFYHYIDEGTVTNPKAYIRDEVLYNWGTKLHFGTSNNTGGTVVANTKMTIDDRGNVGIGTTNPGQTLDIEGNLALNGSLIGGVSSARAYYNLLAARWSGGKTGALVLQTNVPQDDHTMTQTKVILKRQYSKGSTSCEYLISGYWSTETNGGFSGRGYQADCSDIQRIRFMRNNGSGKVVIVIGETNTDWSHPMVAVPEFLAHYGIASDSYADSWTAIIVNDLSGYINSDDVGNSSPIHQTTTRVGIGTNNPQSKLSVNGTITAKEIKVESGWADFVFNEEYDLATLDEVESYIHKNRHLPAIPSAKEVEQEGVSVSEMLAKQMQKIEEMTLYLIQLKKENDQLKERMAMLETAVNASNQK